MTFGYTKQTNQTLPSDPLILRVRKDITWEDILFQYQNDHTLSKSPGIIIIVLPSLLVIINHY